MFPLVISSNYVMLWHWYEPKVLRNVSESALQTIFLMEKVVQQGMPYKVASESTV